MEGIPGFTFVSRFTFGFSFVTIVSWIAVIVVGNGILVETLDAYTFLTFNK